MVAVEDVVETIRDLRDSKGKDWGIVSFNLPDGKLAVVVASQHFFPSDVADVEKELEEILEDFVIQIIPIGLHVALVIESSELE
ncbi:TPA: hypothetical protein EYP13_02015 [Candidatus Micrarchaeota archaeon]|nr:hypothetical protein [Candidatus Micrarchaeota archaeon]